MLAAYRVGDSPVNVITPLMAYFPLIVVFAQRYRKDAGIGTVVSLMLPYVFILASSGRRSSSPGTCSGSRSARGAGEALSGASALRLEKPEMASPISFCGD